IRNYYDTIAADQESELGEPLAFLLEILIRPTLGTLPKNFSFTFNPLWQMSDKEKADIGKVRADTDHIYLTDGILTEGAIARDLKDRDTYRTMEDKDVKLAEELANEPKPDPTALVVPPMRNGANGTNGANGKKQTAQEQ